ncbi:MAG: globin [Campylobacterota bacterium]|nr:globin [Campylobacterota bacterium]
MKLTITDGEIGVRPPVVKPHPGFLHEVGEARFKELVYKHYELIEDSDIAFLFPIHDEDDFDDAKRHAFAFLIEECGGPEYFTQERGKHQMVGRHAPFRIDEAGRKTWLALYAPLLEALVNEGITEEYIQSFWDYLDIFSMWLVNTKS